MDEHREMELVLADREALVRAGLRVVALEHGASVVHESATWADTLRAVAGHRHADLVVLGSFPELDIAGAVAQIRQLAPVALILVFVDRASGDLVLELLDAGVDAVAERRFAAGELRDALVNLVAGEQRVGSQLLSSLLTATIAIELTVAEQRVLDLLGCGSSVDDISTELACDVTEARRVLAGLGQKLGSLSAEGESFPLVA